MQDLGALDRNNYLSLTSIFTYFSSDSEADEVRHTIKTIPISVPIVDSKKVKTEIINQQTRNDMTEIKIKKIERNENDCSMVINKIDVSNSKDFEESVEEKREITNSPSELESSLNKSDSEKENIRESRKKKNKGITEKEYNCDYCPATFANRFAKYDHNIREHETAYRTDRENMLKKKKQWSCELCPKTFRSQDDKYKHKKAAHKKKKTRSGRTGITEKDYNCDYCPATFVNRFAKYEHNIKEHEIAYRTDRENKPQNKKEYICDYCSKKFPHRFAKYEHNIREHKEEYRRDRTIFLENRKLKKKQEMNSSKNASSASLPKHPSSPFETNLTHEKEYVCESCPQRFSTKFAKHKHKMSTHDNNVEIGGPIWSSGEKIFKHGTLTRPLKVDLNDYPYISMEQQEAWFRPFIPESSEERRLLSNIQSPGKSVEPNVSKKTSSGTTKIPTKNEYLCDYCPAIFQHKRAKWEHKVNMHPEEYERDSKSLRTVNGMYQCRYCKSSYSNPGSRTIHERFKHANEIMPKKGMQSGKNNISLENMGVKFNTGPEVETIKQQISSNSSASQPNTPIGVTEESTIASVREIIQTSGESNISKRKSSGTVQLCEKQHICDYCPASFPDRHAKWTHKKNNHPDEYKRDSKSLRTDNGKYQCRYCGSLHSNAGSRSLHERFKHSNEATPKNATITKKNNKSPDNEEVKLNAGAEFHTTKQKTSYDVSVPQAPIVSNTNFTTVVTEVSAITYIGENTQFDGAAPDLLAATNKRLEAWASLGNLKKSNKRKLEPEPEACGTSASPSHDGSVLQLRGAKKSRDDILIEKDSVKIENRRNYLSSIETSSPIDKENYDYDLQSQQKDLEDTNWPISKSSKIPKIIKEESEEEDCLGVWSTLSYTTQNCEKVSGQNPHSTEFNSSTKQEIPDPYTKSNNEVSEDIPNNNSSTTNSIQMLKILKEESDEDECLGVWSTLVEKPTRKRKVTKGVSSASKPRITTPVNQVGESMVETWLKTNFPQSKNRRTAVIKKDLSPVGSSFTTTDIETNSLLKDTVGEVYAKTVTEKDADDDIEFIEIIPVGKRNGLVASINSGSATSISSTNGQLSASSISRLSQNSSCPSLNRMDVEKSPIPLSAAIFTKAIQYPKELMIVWCEILEEDLVSAANMHSLNTLLCIENLETFRQSATIKEVLKNSTMVNFSVSKSDDSTSQWTLITFSEDDPPKGLANKLFQGVEKVEQILTEYATTKQMSITNMMRYNKEGLYNYLTSILSGKVTAYNCLQ